MYWNLLAAGDLDPLDKTVVHIAYGCSVLERAGGITATLSTILVETITAVADAHDPPPPPPTPLYRHLRGFEPPP